MILFLLQAKFKNKPVGTVVGLKFNDIEVCNAATTAAPEPTTEAPTPAPTSAPTPGNSNCHDLVSNANYWHSGGSGTLKVKFPATVSSWKITIEFTAPVYNFEIWVGENIECAEDGLSCTFENKPWNGQMSAGQELDIAFLYAFDSTANIDNVSIDGNGVCGDDSR